MKIDQYRLYFDAPVEKRFSQIVDFETWCAEHLSDLNYHVGGYRIISARHLVHQPGVPTWFVTIPGEESHASFDPADVVTFLAARGWVVDGIRVLLYTKRQGEGEALFPIWSAE